MKKLSIHRPKKKSYTKEMLGYYLAGLIDGDGHISKIGHVVISFNKKDVKTAFKLRSHLKYGQIRPVKNKQACNFIISNKKGVLFLASLIKDKLKHPTRIKQYNERLSKKFNIKETSLNTEINWNTPWFAGFFDTDGYLRIAILERKNRPRSEVRLLGQIDQKTDILLKQIQIQFGGYLGYRLKQNTFYYSTVSFGNMFKLLSYFDKFSLQNDRFYLRYVLIRKSYLLVQEKYHLSNKGLIKLKKYKKKLKDMT